MVDRRRRMVTWYTLDHLMVDHLTVDYLMVDHLMVDHPTGVTLTYFTATSTNMENHQLEETTFTSSRFRFVINALSLFKTTSAI